MDALITIALVGFLAYCVIHAVRVLATGDTNYTSTCRYCGKRKKFKPGWFLLGTDTRYTTCRSCGAEDC